MEFFVTLAVGWKLAVKYSYFRTYFNQDRYFEKTKTRVIFLSSLWTSFSIKTFICQRLKWPPSLLVCICLHFNGPPHPISMNVIIEWTRLTFLARKIFIQNKHKGNRTKTKSTKSKLLKILNMNQFWASWSSDFIYKDLNTRKLEFGKWALIWSFNH